MAERRLPIPERPWHRSESGRWSLSLGVRGLKVRVEQRKRGSTFQRVYRTPGGRVTYASLKTTDRAEARELAIASSRASARSVVLRERSEEHTSELQSRLHLVCRLLLEK